MAGVVLQQWVDAHGLFAGQVVIDHRIRQGNQQTLAAVAALDARFLAHPHPPLVGASRCIA
jgi:hypothetical protein